MTEPPINTEAANLGPAWVRVAGECTESPTQTPRATIEDQIAVIVARLRNDMALLVEVQELIYNRHLPVIGS